MKKHFLNKAIFFTLLCSIHFGLDAQEEINSTNHIQSIVLGSGCFWGAERLFWKLPGIHVTAVGYAGGATPNPTYEETCSGLTGHTEVVLLVYDPVRLPLDRVLTSFWQAHDPTQGFRQGNDRGTQYRSAIFVMDDDDLAAVTSSAEQYQKALAKAGFGQITTEIRVNDQFYYAEDYHQQYLHKVPNGYCGLQGTGVSAGLADENKRIGKGLGKARCKD